MRNDVIKHNANKTRKITSVCLKKVIKFI